MCRGWLLEPFGAIWADCKMWKYLTLSIFLQRQDPERCTQWFFLRNNTPAAPFSVKCCNITLHHHGNIAFSLLLQILQSVCRMCVCVCLDSLRPMSWSQCDRTLCSSESWTSGDREKSPVGPLWTCLSICACVCVCVWESRIYTPSWWTVINIHRCVKIGLAYWYTAATH